jgi:hypothetical protein
MSDPTNGKPQTGLPYPFSRWKTREDAPPAEPSNGQPRPPETQRHVRLWIARSMHPTLVTFVESYITGLAIHRIDQRSVMCLKGLRYCYGCKVGAPTRWRGYIAAQISRTRTPIVCEITPWCALNTPRLVELDGKLHRVQATFRRATSSPQSKLWCEVLDERTAEVIPYRPRSAPILARVFECDESEVSVQALEPDAEDIDGAAGGRVR